MGQLEIHSVSEKSMDQDEQIFRSEIEDFWTNSSKKKYQDFVQHGIPLTDLKAPRSNWSLDSGYLFGE